MHGLAHIPFWTDAKLLEKYRYALRWKDSPEELERDVFHELERNIRTRGLPLQCPKCGRVDGIARVASGDGNTYRCSNCGTVYP